MATRERRKESPSELAAQSAHRRTAVGFTVKSGWTCAVLIEAGATPLVVDSTRLDLSDPAIPESRQPYHEGFATVRPAGGELSRLLASVQQFGHRAVGDLLARYQTAGGEVVGAGLVVGSLLDPKQLANEHMRIHGLEGQLFRRVVEEAVAANGLTVSVCRERDLYELAERGLRRPSQEIREAVNGMGKAMSGPWRAEHKAATIAAWLVLAGLPFVQPSTRARKS